MAVLINKETGQAFEVADDEASGAAASMGLSLATPEQIDWLRKQREYEAKSFTEKAGETAQSYTEGLMQVSRELGKLRVDDSGLASSLLPEQATQVKQAGDAFQERTDKLLSDPGVQERAERHPLAHSLGVDTPALFVSGGVAGKAAGALGRVAGMAAESVAVGGSEEAVNSTVEGREFDVGQAAEIAQQDLIFSGLAAAATKVASRVGGLLMFGTGNATARNVKHGLDSASGPIVPDDVRFDGPLLEAETRSRRTAAASAPDMPPSPERDEMLRNVAPDLNQKVTSEAGDMFDSTVQQAKSSVVAPDEDMISRRVEEMLPKTSPAQTSWSADATRKFDEMRTAMNKTTDPAAAPFVQRAQQIADEAVAAIDGSSDASTWFRASAAARDKLDALADEIGASGLPATHRAGLIVDDARGYLGRTLSDRSLFGAAADMHAELHSAARDKVATAVRNAGGDLRTRLSEFVSADAAARTQMRAPLEQAIEGFEELAAAHEKYGTASPKTIETLRENADKLRRSMRLADDVESAVRNKPAPEPPKATPEPTGDTDFARAETLADQIRKRAGQEAKSVGVQAAQRIVDYAAGPGRAVYDDAVSDALKGAIQTVGAIGGLAAMGPPGFVAGWLGARSIGKKMAPKVGQQILDAAQRYVKNHGADTAGVALLGAAALGEGDEEGGDSSALAASVGGLFFARRFAERALGAAGQGAKAAGKGLYRASEVVTGAVDNVTGKATEALGRGTYKAGRAVGETAGAAVDTVARVAADEDLVKSAIRSGVRDPKKWLRRNTTGRIADKAAEYFGPRISKTALEWLERRSGKTATETVQEAVQETAEAARKSPDLLPEHTEQAGAMVDDIGAQLEAALKETPEARAAALAAFPQRLGGSAAAQRQALVTAIDELVADLGKVSEPGAAEAAQAFATMAQSAIKGARTAQERFRIGMQLTQTLADHTARAGDGEMSKVFGAQAERMWETMSERELWLGKRELEREAKRQGKKRELLLSKLSAGEKLGIAAVGGSALIDDDDTGAALASAGGLGIAGRRLGMWKIGREAVNLDHVADPIAKLREMGAKPALLERVASRLDAASRPIAETAIEAEQHAAVAAKNQTLWSEAEREAISDYQGEGYRDVNEALRSGEKAPAEIIAALDKAVAAGNVTPGMIWRGVDLPEADIERLKQSSHVMAQGILSGATNDARARVFSPGEYGNRPVLFRIEQKTGVPVEESGEAEVLMRPGTKFEVVGVGRDRYEGGPYTKSDTDWKHIDTIDLREVGQVAEKSRRSFMKQHGGKVAAGGLFAVGSALDDEDNGAALASAGAMLGLRRLSGFKPEHQIVKELEELGLKQSDSLHVWKMLQEAKVPTRPGRMSREFDASKVGVTGDGKLVVFDKKGFAQGASRLQYQMEKSGAAPAAVTGGGGYEQMRERTAAIQRADGFDKPSHRGHDTIEVNQKALTALARSTATAIKKLEPEEQLALLDYIEGGGASTFRRLQRGDMPGADKTRYAESLPAFEGAVDKLQKTGLTEKVGPLWRGMHLSPEQATELVNSKHVETGSLTSTSFEPFYAKDMFADTQAAAQAGHVPIVLKFEHVNRAAPISAVDFSKQYGTREREALLPKGSTFEVTSAARPESNDYIELTLREVPKSDAMKVGFVLAGLLGLGAALSPDEASAAEPEPEAPPPDDRTVAAQRILSIDQAATQRIRHTARVLVGLAKPPDPEGLTTALDRFGAEHGDPRAAFEERKATLQKSEISPALVYDVIGATLGDVASVSPELYQATAARLLDNFRYLRENLPPEIKSSMVYPTGMPPSESSMRDWATQWNTVMDQESVLDDIDRGTVTHLQINTLQGAHPDTYERLRTEIMSEVGANFADIPTSTKMQLDILFQADGLAGPMFSSEAAAIIGEASAVAAKQKQPGPADSSPGGEDVAAGPNGLEAIRTSVTNRGA